jgi:hypothetical protein
VTVMTHHPLYGSYPLDGPSSPQSRASLRHGTSLLACFPKARTHAARSVGLHMLRTDVSGSVVACPPGDVSVLNIIFLAWMSLGLRACLITINAIQCRLQGQIEPVVACIPALLCDLHTF